MAARRRALIFGSVGWTIGGGAQALGPGQAGRGRRIVAVGSAVTETLHALGVGHEIVGVDTTSRFPERVRELPSVGYMRTLSLEGMMSLAPTHVVATEEAGPPGVLQQLTQSGVAVKILPTTYRLEGVLNRTAAIGQFVGQPDAARGLVQQIQTQWHQSQKRVADHAGRPLRVLFVLSHSMSQIMVTGRHTAADAMLQLAGFRNPMADHIQGNKPLTAEAALLAAPDVILVTDQGLSVAGGVKGILGMPGLGQTPAGQLRRVVAMDAALLLSFGPRLPEAVTQLNTRVRQAMRT